MTAKFDEDIQDNFNTVADPYVAIADWEKGLESGNWHWDEDSVLFADIQKPCQYPKALNLETLLWAYGVLLHDEKLNSQALNNALPAMTEALVRALIQTPLEKQALGDLVIFMTRYNEALASGRFNKENAYCIETTLGQLTQTVQQKFGNPISAPKIQA